MSDFRIEVHGINAIADEFDAAPRIVQMAGVRATNRAIVSAETLQARFIRDDLGLKVSDVKKAMKSRKATAARPTAVLAASLKRIALIKFSARGPEPSRGRGRGVSYKLKGSRGRIESAFITTMPKHGHRGVFVRLGRPSRSNPKREAIGERFGPSIGHVFAKGRPAALAHAIERFRIEFNREAAFRKARAEGRV